MKDINIMEVYANYTHSLEYYRDFGVMYGDTPELIRMYEKMLSDYKIKIMTKDGRCEREKVKVKEIKLKR